MTVLPEPVAPLMRKCRVSLSNAICIPGAISRPGPVAFLDGDSVLRIYLCACRPLKS
jgi:hypothetical protein